MAGREVKTLDLTLAGPGSIPDLSEGQQTDIVTANNRKSFILNASGHAFIEKEFSTLQ